MTSNKELLLVHTFMDDVRQIHPVNVMLTPQFYTLKKEELPVKYAYQAKKIAPSLFDGLLEDAEVYEYSVFKEEDNWVFIAYNMAKISHFLESKGFELDKVGKLFFAQQSLEDFAKEPLALGDNDALTVVDETVVVVPRVVLDENIYLSSRITNAFTPESAGIRVKSNTVVESSFFTQTQAFSIAAIFILFAGMFGVEGSRYTGDSQIETEELEHIYEEYAYLRSSYTRQDAMDKYTRIDKIERKKRDAIKASSNMIFKGVTLTTLKVDEKNFKSEFSCIDEDVSNRVKALAKKSKNDFLNIKGNTTLIVEGKL